MSSFVSGSAQAPRYETLVGAIERVSALPPTAPKQSTLTDVYGVVVDCSFPRPTKGPGEGTRTVM